MATRDIRLYTPGNNDLTSLSAARELAPFLHLSVPEGAPKRAKIPDRLFKLLELDEDNDNDTQLKDLISLGISTAPAYDAFSFAHNAG